MLKGLNHLTLAVRDTEISLSFYQNILGFKALYKHSGGAYLQAGSLWLCLEVDQNSRSGPLPEDSHCAFSCAPDDFTFLVSRIEASGAKAWKENRSEGASYYFLDPDYHKLEIHVGDLRSRLVHYAQRPDRVSYILGSVDLDQQEINKTSLMIPEISLVPFRKEFVESFMNWRRQPRSVAHNPVSAKSREETMAFLAAEATDLAAFAKVHSFRWFIEFEGKPVGTVSLKNINRMMGYAEIAYGIDQNYYGRGIATAAVKTMISSVFAKTSLRKLIAFVHDENETSLRLLDRLGFQREGKLRQHYIINGKPCHEIVFGLLREEWSEGS